MIVEDESASARTMAYMLRNHGYEYVTIVPSGSKAVQAVVEEKPDLVLMDIGLEGDIEDINQRKLAEDVLRIQHDLALALSAAPDLQHALDCLS